MPSHFFLKRLEEFGHVQHKRHHDHVIHILMAIKHRNVRLLDLKYICVWL